MRVQLLGIAPLALLAACGLLSPFEAGPAKLEEASLFAAGAKVSCPVKNTSGKPTPATVSYRLALADGTVVTGEEYAMLDPKEPKVVTHTFEGLRVKDREGVQVECSARTAK